ncbi:MAG: hypothetical protein JWN67_1667 [Actinomycetia bacterium]|nr:hypothetical protein [Actinomycetes bacterium]
MATELMVSLRRLRSTADGSLALPSSARVHV